MLQVRYLNIAWMEPHTINAVRDPEKFAVLLRVRSRGTGHVRRTSRSRYRKHLQRTYYLAGQRLTSSHS